VMILGTSHMARPSAGLGLVLARRRADRTGGVLQGRAAATVSVDRIGLAAALLLTVLCAWRRRVQRPG